MRFPRNAKIFRGQLDPAPFAGVVFLLLIFLVFHTKFVHTPGIPITLPEIPHQLPGVSGPSVVVAVDVYGRFYYEHKIVAGEAELFEKLKKTVEQSKIPLTLEIRIDRAISTEIWSRLAGIAAKAGFKECLLALQPKTDAPVVKKPSNTK